MANDDLHIHKDEPPEKPEEWQRIHRAAHRVEQSWWFLGALNGAVKSWPLLVFVVVAIAYINNDAIVEAARALTGIKK